jgi:hypothetical protein
LTKDEAFGEISIFVIDPLVAPDACPTTIALLIEVAGAEDMEYIDPGTTIATPCIPYAVQAGQEYKVQSGETQMEVLDCYCLGKVSTPSVAVDKAAIGERVTSFRQLIKRLGTRPHTLTWPTGNHFTFFPFWHSVFFQPTSIGTTPTAPLLNGDVLGLVSLCYGICTGSVRVQVWGVGYSPDTVALIANGDSTNGGIYNNATISGEATNYYTTLSKEGSIDVQVPAYNLFLGRPNASNVAVTAGTIYPNTVGSCKRAITCLSTDTTQSVGTTITVTRQAADDYNCIWFVATPTLY